MELSFRSQGPLRSDLVPILALGLAVRVITIVAFPSLHHPDENFQLFEQAHRLAFGYGIEPWEFRDGIRSLVLPAALAGSFRFFALMGAGPRGYILGTRIALACLSLISVAAAYQTGLQRSRTHAILAGLVAATWFEFVYFSGRPLTEAVAANFLIVALCLASTPERRYTQARLLALGTCLGLCLMLRAHLAIGLFVIAVWVVRSEIIRRSAALALGAALPVAAFGASDWFAWGSPFHSYITAFRINVILDKASNYGIEPMYWYLQQMGAVWVGALPVLLYLIAIRRRSSALWILVATAIIASHALIGHKEYRFVFPAFACLILVAAMGSADLIERLGRHHGAKIALRSGAVAVVLWIATSASLAMAPGYFDQWFLRRDLIQASFRLFKQPSLCGLLLYDYPWGETGGYAFLHRKIPIYPTVEDPESALRASAAFNVILAKRASLSSFVAPFHLDECMGGADPEDLCIIERKGDCVPDDSLHPLLQQRGLGE